MERNFTTLTKLVFLSLLAAACFFAGLSLGLYLGPRESYKEEGPTIEPTSERVAPTIEIPVSSPAPTPTPTATPSLIQGRVIKVIDGDTIEVEIEGTRFPLRYIGVDAEEEGACGRQETARNRELVEGQTVDLERDTSEVDAFGRLLRYVWVDGLFVNAQLVREGYARARAYPPDTRYADLFAQLEEEAREAGRGCWAPTPTTTATIPPSPVAVPIGVVVDESCSQFNAPGNDNENKSQEWVCFRNNGPQPVEMGGWRVQDEYGWGYTFPPFTLEAGGVVRLHTGCGQNTPTDVYWCKEGYAVWNNDGDTVFLFDTSGDLVAEQSY